MENDDKHIEPDQDTTEQEQNPCTVERITDGIKEARQCCEDVQRKATESLKNARETTLGDVLDKAAVFVKRHPRSSLGIAVALGFFLGRLFRR